MKRKKEIEYCLIGVKKIIEFDGITKFSKGFCDALKWVLEKEGGEKET